MLLGVQKGIEKASKILMPILVVLSIVVAVYTITMPGAWEGVLYYITPDFSKFSPMTVLAALGQLFYSMSLAMGIMITYGSYMKKEANLEKSVKQIEIFDTGIALVAGLMIVPAVFVFSGGDQSQLQQGPSLMFVTLPKVFESMGTGRPCNRRSLLPVGFVRRAYFRHLAHGNGCVLSFRISFIGTARLPAWWWR